VSSLSGIRGKAPATNAIWCILGRKYVCWLSHEMMMVVLVSSIFLLFMTKVKENLSSSASVTRHANASA